ncbi:MAG: ParA family protein [Halobacteriovoraceae bacterium]|nr:ParA family protein [Halobacteriovoraceae bacterium]
MFEKDYPVHIKDFTKMFGLSDKTPYELFKRDPQKYQTIKKGSNTFISADSVRNYRISRKKHQDDKIDKIVSFYMRKGGVGKTTILINLAVRATQYGYKVIIVDMDSQANVTRTFKIDQPKNKDTFLNIFDDDCEVDEAIIEVRKNLHLIPANNKLTGLAKKIDPMKGFQQFKPFFQQLKSEYDLVLIDCGGIMDMTIFQVLSISDEIISPAFPDEYSDEGLELTLEEIEKLHYQGFNPKLRIVQNRFDHNLREKASRDFKELFEDLYGDHLAKTVIRKSQDFVNASSESKSIFEYNHLSPVCTEIDSLFQEIKGRPLQ